MNIACYLGYIVECGFGCVVLYLLMNPVLSLSVCVSKAHFKHLGASTCLPQLPKYVE